MTISGLIEAILTGLAAIGTVAAIWSVFYPVGPVFQIVLIIVSAGVALFHGRGLAGNLCLWIKSEMKALHPLAACLGAIIFVLIWIKAACLSGNNDEGGYYLPLIKWMEQYPLVPGIANIEDRMGYNSNFHLLSAVFGFAFPDGKGFYDLGSLYLLLQQALSLRFLQLLLKSEGLSFEKKWFYSVAAASAWYVNYITLSSPDTDLPANALSWMLLVLFVENVLFKKDRDDGRFFCFLAIQAVFLATMRFSGVWLVFLPLWLLIRRSAGFPFKKKLLVFTAIGALILLPWCYRNYRISGYLVYPLYSVDLFEPDWKVPVAKAKENYYYVRDYARRTTDVRSYDPGRTDNIIRWLPVTFQKKSLVGKFFIVFVLVLTVAGLVSFLTQWRRWCDHPDFLFLSGFLIFNLLWWLYAFPDFRFAQAQLSLAVVAVIFFFILKMISNRRFPNSKLIAGVLIIVWSLHGIMIFRSPSIVTCGILVPAPPFPSDAIIATFQRHFIYRTEHFSCGCATPPCLNWKTSPDLSFRGKDVRDGFRIVAR